MDKKIRKAIIPAAGLGTRFLPATKAQPKEMLPIVDKPTIQYIIEEAIASGIEEILIITRRSKKCIEDHFDRSVELELELEKSGKQSMLDMVQDISNIFGVTIYLPNIATSEGASSICGFSTNPLTFITLSLTNVPSTIPYLLTFSCGTV